jgi:hypothetical protein
MPSVFIISGSFVYIEDVNHQDAASSASLAGGWGGFVFDAVGGIPETVHCAEVVVQNFGPENLF